MTNIQKTRLKTVLSLLENSIKLATAKTVDLAELEYTVGEALRETEKTARNQPLRNPFPSEMEF